MVSRSQIFYDMFSDNNFIESKSQSLSIDEYPAEDFFVFLLYLYSDVLSLDIDISLELLKGADMYAVFNLKNRIENLLSSKLEIDNASKILKYASFYNHEKLKKVSLAFINDNYKQVIDTQEFENLPQEFLLEIIRFCKSK